MTVAQVQLSICLFGSLSVSLGAGGDLLPLGGRIGSLLAYLALGRGRYFSRGELMSALWPDRPEGASPGSLNTTLWRLRRAVERPPLKSGDLIACDRRGAIGLSERACLRLDVEEFERLTTPGLAKPPHLLAAADIERLRQGCRLYTADILTDLGDEWALRAREKHRRSYLNALGRLMQLSAMAGDYADSIRHAQAILDCDALREDVHRELMHLFVQNGQRALALRQFEQCRSLLRRELAIQPMRETLALYRRIADSAVGNAGSETERPAPIPAAMASLQAPAILSAAPASVRGLIDAARKRIAEADDQLQLSLRFLDE